MNNIIIMGRLCQDPEVRYSQEGKAVAKVSIAVNRRFKQEGQADADFFNLVAFGKTAEFIEKYFHKGMKALVSGELRNNNYTDKDGVKHYSNNIVINTIEFAESKNSTPATDSSGFMEIPDGFEEELPFN